MNPMMMNNNLIINQMDQPKIFQKIEQNNEQIIQMIQQIFKIQMMNNLLLNQILNSNNLNNINNMMNQMDNSMNDFNMINNQNILMNNNDNYINSLAGCAERKINITFKYYNNNNFEGTKYYNLVAPGNISVKESIEGFWEKSGINDPNEQKKCVFSIGPCFFNILNINDTRPIDENKTGKDIFIHVEVK